uniref:Uncharacterized protein n=1 Tax=Rhizophora mucronata TaxID=61149 RepID=A0A2P2NKF6_RHIMU
MYTALVFSSWKC